MKAVLKNPFVYLPYILIALFICSVNFFILKERDDLIIYSAILIGLLVLLDLVLFNAKYLVYLAVICIPLSVKYELGNSGTVISLPSEILAGLLAIILFWKIFFPGKVDKKILTHPLTVLLFIDLFWMIFTSFFSTLPVVSLKRVMVRLIFILAYFLLFSHWFSEKKNVPKFYILYALGLVYVMFHIFQNHAHYNFAQQASFLVTQPFYADHTVYGACLAFILPFLLIFFFRSKIFEVSIFDKAFIGIIITLVLAAQFLSFSRAAIVSLIAALVFYWLLKFRVGMKSLMLIFISCGIVVAMFFDTIYNTVKENEAVSGQENFAEHLQSVTNISTDNSNLERINRWICAVRMFKERPVLGFGPGTYQFEYGKFQTRYEMNYLSTYHGDKGNAHSEYLTYLSESGFPGLVIFTLIVLVTISTGLRVIYNTEDMQVKFLATAVLLGLVTFFFHGFFNSFIDQDKAAILVFGSMAALTAFDINLKKSISK